MVAIRRERQLGVETGHAAPNDGFGVALPQRPSQLGHRAPTFSLCSNF